MKRSLFLGGTAALAAAPAPLRAQSPSPAKLRIAASAVSDIIIVLWGVQGGIFQKYGLDVDLSRMNSSSAVTAAVLGGSLDLGKASLFSLIVARSKGLPIILEAPSALYSSAAPDSALVVAKNSTIQTAKDLNGKLLASASLGDLFTTVNAAWIDQNGGDSKTLKYVELPGTATADAIVAGRVDAGTLAEPILTDAIRSGKCRAIGYPEDVIGKLSLATAYFTTADFAAKNAAVLARFRKACDESVTYVKAHPADMIPLVSKFSGIDPKNVSLGSLGRAADLLDPRLTQPTIDIAAKYKAIAKPFSVKEMIDPSAFSA